jgi:hypothetical protein
MVTLQKDNHWQDCTGATEKNFTKPMKRRGRKPSNLSPEERRKRRLERGRLAANKCRKKKRQLEGELESKASDLLIERDRMLKINHSLKDEIRELQAEILKHVGSDCGGIPGHLAVSSSPPKALHMGGQSYSRRDNGGATDLERLEEGFGERVGDSPDSDAMHSSHSLMSIVSDAQVMAEIDNVGSRSAEEIVRAVLGGLGRNGR